MRARLATTSLSSAYIYRNGEFVKDKNGKPITYKNTDQPGTVGFDYKF